MKTIIRQYLTRSLGTLALISTTGGALVHAGAVQASALPRAGTHVLGAVSNPAAPRPAASFKPIGVPTPFPVLPSGTVAAPGLSPLQATASSVTVSWSDSSTNELGFKVFRRDLSGNWQPVDQVATRDVRGTGDEYTWVDTSTDLSGQCYMVTAYNSTSVGTTSEECTVRPDPSRFPQLVPGWAPAWSGLSDVNDGTGQLVNVDNEKNLEHGNQTFGVDLIFGDTSLWRVEAQGGPHLMKGEAVALKVWGGGWLAYGNQTFGVDLQLSPTPVYEWYAIGLRNDPADRSWAGSDLLDGGTFALWNSSARDYLVAHYQTWGVSLDWASKIVVGPPPVPTPVPTPPAPTERVYNCLVEMDNAIVFIDDETSNSGFVDLGRIVPAIDSEGNCPKAGWMPLTYTLQSGHQYQLVATDPVLITCDGEPVPGTRGCTVYDMTFTAGGNGYTHTDYVTGYS